jgi:S-adenosylmethionine decarboxylase
MRALGRHLLVELYGCEPRQISDVPTVQEIMVAAAKATRANILDVVFHAFKPHGVSGVVVIAESHLAIHTWPEHSFASVDVYTCGRHVNPWKAPPVLKRLMRAKKMTAMEIKRGILVA